MTKNLTNTLSELARWFAQHARSFSWRSMRQTAKDNGQLQQAAYLTLLSEIMLQQTLAKVVETRFPGMVQRWPKLENVAASSLDEVYYAWQGLGYYRRAHNFWRCAREICSNHNGVIPHKISILQSLPGIGKYTSYAIASQAFNQPVLAVDSNVRRVLCRYHGWQEVRSSDLSAFESAWSYSVKAGALMCEAMIELGATVCRPRDPQCHVCPLAKTCRGKQAPGNYPCPVIHKTRPKRFAFFFACTHGKRVLLAKLPGKGVLANTWMLPGTSWRLRQDVVQQPFSLNNLHHESPALRLAGGKQASYFLDDHVFIHVFTHFSLHARLVWVHGADRSVYPVESEQWRWSPLDGSTLPLSSLTRKAMTRLVDLIEVNHTIGRAVPVEKSLEIDKDLLSHFLA